MAKTETRTRQHEHVVDIAASPETVWQAITDAEQLVQWFPLDAEVTPGDGGEITYGWGDDLRGTCRIRAWEPGQHLSTSWMTPTGEGAPLVVDWFLEGTRGGTRLRLVHSGFGMGGEWDNEYEGTRRGWSYELRSLKHYLEVHAGRTRRAFWLHRATALTPEQAWTKLISPTGLIQGELADSALAGERVSLTLAGAGPVRGSLLLVIRPTDLALRVDDWNDGLFRAAHEDCGRGPEIGIFVSLWDYPEAEAAALEEKLDEALRRHFA